MSERFDHIVVGGGVIGLAAAWQLAARGRRVLLLERYAPGHLRGASHGATRNMNNAYGESHYLDLYDEALELWHELEAASGERLLTLCGLVTHGDPDTISGVRAALDARGAATELIDPAEASSRWPGMRFSGAVLVNRDAGRVHAATALEVLAAEAVRHGAEIRSDHRVMGIEADGDRVRVRAEIGSDPGIESWFEAAGVVVAAGAWSAELLRGLVDLPRLTVTEEHPAHFAMRSEFREPGAEDWWPSFNHLRDSGRPGHAHGTVDAVGAGDGDGTEASSPDADPRGGAVYGMLTPGEGIKVGFHLVGDAVDPDARRFRASELMRQGLRDYVAEWFPGLDPDSAVEISCTYTSTESGRFVLDRVGPVTVAAGFSGHGFKFAPAIGRVLADAALGVAYPPAPFRLAAH